MIGVSIMYFLTFGGALLVFYLLTREAINSYYRDKEQEAIKKAIRRAERRRYE